MKISSHVLKSVFARQVGATTIAQALTLTFSLVTASITARWLGPEGKGMLAMIIMVPTLFQLFLGFGLVSANVYYTGANRIKVHQLTENTMAFSLLGTLIGVFIILLAFSGDLLRFLLPGVPPGYLALGMIALPFGLLSSNFSAVLQGLRRILTLNIINVIRSALSVVFMAVCLVWFELGLPGAIFATLTVHVIVFGSFVRLIKREGGSFVPRWDREIVRPTFTFGLKSYISNLMQFFTYRLDLFFINFFLGPAEVGIYSVSVVIAELLWQIPNATSFVLLPKSANSSPAEMNRFTPKVFKVIFIITLLGAIGLAILGRPFILVIFSKDFMGAYVPLLILLPGVVLLGVAKILANDVGGRGYPLYNSITAGVSLIVTILFDFLLIPAMGVAGAALASTIAYSMTFIFSVFIYIYVSRKFSE